MSNRFLKLELESSRQEPQAPAAQQQSKQTSGSTQSFSNAFTRGEDHDAAYWMHQADLNRRSGQYEEALRQYSRAVELDRVVIPAWVGQVQMLIALKEYPEADLWVRKALELFKNHPDLLAGRSQALTRDGQTSTALAVCDAALTQPGESAYRWIVRGEVMLARKDQIEQHCFEKAVQLDGDWVVLLEIGRIYVHYRRHSKAMTRFRQATEKAPDQPFCWYNQGCCERAMGLMAPARRSFKHCLDLQPKHSQARMQLIELDKAEGGFFKRLFRPR